MASIKSLIFPGALIISKNLINTHPPDALRYLITSAGSDHVLLRSDDPYDMADANPVQTVSKLSGIKAANGQKIVRKNAIALFGLKGS